MSVKSGRDAKREADAMKMSDILDDEHDEKHAPDYDDERVTKAGRDKRLEAEANKWLKQATVKPPKRGSDKRDIWEFEKSFFENTPPSTDYSHFKVFDPGITYKDYGDGSCSADESVTSDEDIDYEGCTRGDLADNIVEWGPSPRGSHQTPLDIDAPEEPPQFPVTVRGTILCPGCDRYKTRNDFSPDNRKANGLQTHCKTCEAERTQRRRSKG